MGARGDYSTGGCDCGINPAAWTAAGKARFFAVLARNDRGWLARPSSGAGGGGGAFGELAAADDGGVLGAEGVGLAHLRLEGALAGSDDGGDAGAAEAGGEGGGGGGGPPPPGGGQQPRA